MENKRAEFKELTDREHCLERPSMYIGGVDLIEKEQWLFDKAVGKFRYGTVRFVPALLKCVNEILDNSLDVAIDTDFAAANQIKLDITADSITVTDNGIGIPVQYPKDCRDQKPENSIPCKCWTKLKAGTSFGKDQDKIGANGLGSCVVNVFSKRFVGRSDDGKKQQTIECSDNMSVVKAGKFKPSSGKPGCKVTVYPDFSRFGVGCIDETHMNLVYQRLINLAICYPKIKFVFNGERVKVNEKEFGRMFSDSCEIVSTGNTTVAVFPNEYDEFKFYSTVNGLSVPRGGTHIDYIASEICSRLRDKLIKKYKTIRPGDAKTKLAMIVFMTGFKNCKWDSQTKEMLQNSQADVTAHLGGKIDFNDFAKKILKNDAITGPIVETFKIKEELKARQELKTVKKIKVKSDKYMSPIGARLNLFLCEGQSAQSSLCSCLGRESNGYYSLRGLPINVLENSIQKIAANQEFKDVMNILDLDIARNDDSDKRISFERVVIACDQDLDGNHLSSVLIGWFRKFAPNLFKEGRICKLQTPLIIVKDQKDTIKEYFFDLDSFKAWEKKNTDKKLKIFYQKGLGSIERSDMKWLMENNGGVNQFLYELIPDRTGFDNVDLWLSGDAEPRKEKLRQYTLDINMA